MGRRKKHGREIYGIDTRWQRPDHTLSMTNPSAEWLDLELLSTRITHAPQQPLTVRLLQVSARWRPREAPERGFAIGAARK